MISLMCHIARHKVIFCESAELMRYIIAKFLALDLTVKERSCRRSLRLYACLMRSGKIWWRTWWTLYNTDLNRVSSRSATSSAAVWSSAPYRLSRTLRRTIVSIRSWRAMPWKPTKHETHTVTWQAPPTCIWPSARRHSCRDSALLMQSLCTAADEWWRPYTDGQVIGEDDANLSSRPTLISVTITHKQLHYHNIRILYCTRRHAAKTLDSA